MKLYFDQLKKKPGNILVSYKDHDGQVSDFSCKLTDWGTSNLFYSGDYFGGTPSYAGPRSYELFNKDLFSFGRLALDLFLREQGLVVTLYFYSNTARLAESGPLLSPFSTRH